MSVGIGASGAEGGHWARSFWFGLLLVVLGWALFALPLAGARGLIYEEGRHALAAWGMAESGDYGAPSVLGWRFVEKPPLFYWLILGSTGLFGDFSEWAVRLPSLLAGLATALLVYGATRRHLAASPAAGSAALIAAAAFLFSPFMFSKVARAELDIAIMAFSFAAWVLWLDYVRRGRHWAWVPVALALIAVAYLKGPLFLAYFGIGAGLTVIFERKWRELIPLTALGLILLAAVLAWYVAIYRPGDAAAWRGFSRAAGWPSLGDYLAGQGKFLGETIGNFSPWLFVVLPVLFAPWRRAHQVDGGLVRPYIVYALGCSLALAFWPGALPRYTLSALPAVALLVGIVADAALRQSRPWARRLLIGMVVVGALARIGWFVWIAQDDALMGNGRSPATALAAEIGRPEDPVFFESPFIDYNIAFYMKRAGYPVGELRLRPMAGPIWIVTALPSEDRPVRLEVAGRRDWRYRLLRIEAGDAY